MNEFECSTGGGTDFGILTSHNSKLPIYSNEAVEIALREFYRDGTRRQGGVTPFVGGSNTLTDCDTLLE